MRNFPHLRSLALSAFVAVALLSLPGTVSAQGSGPEQSMLERINALRAEHGLGALLRDNRLDTAARVHTEEMASRGELMHVSTTTGTPVDRAHAAGIDATDLAENVAMHHTVEEAQASLEASAAHLTNMLGARATHVGLSAISTASGIYVTQLYAHLEVPAVATVAPEAPSGSVVAVDVPVPSTSPVEADQAVAPAGPAPVPDAPVAAALPGWVPAAGGGSAMVVPPDPSGVVRVPAPAPGVNGYWICAPDARGGRWYYYPVRPGVSGAIRADLSVTGSPPGYSSACSASSVSAPVAPAPAPGRVMVTPWGTVRIESR